LPASSLAVSSHLVSSHLVSRSICACPPSNSKCGHSGMPSEHAETDASMDSRAKLCNPS
jgi:hypothetical protein